MVPVKYNMVKEMCVLPAKSMQQARHFTKILNIQSQFSIDKLSTVKQRPIRTENDELPSVEELYFALDRISNGKAAAW